MTTITATPDPATGSVLLDITRGRNTVQRIRRTDANGTVEVRSLADQFPASPGTARRRTNLAQPPHAGYGLGSWARTGAAGTLDIADKAGAKRYRFTSGGTGWAKTNYAVLGNGGAVFPDAAAASSLQIWTDPGILAALSLTFKDKAGTGLGTVSSTYAAYPDGGTAEVRAAAPAGTYLVEVTVRARPETDLPAGTTARVWFDRHTLVSATAAGLPSADVSYFDGTTPATEDRWYAWLGAAGGASVEYVSDRVIVTDYEAAAGRVQYAVETDAGSVTATVDLDLLSPWLVVPLMPNYSEAVDALTGYGSQRESMGTLRRVMNREDPLPALSGLAFRTGSLAIPADTLADAQRIEGVFARGQVVMLRGLVPAMDMYFTAQRVACAIAEPDGEDTTYEVSVDFAEVARPAGPQSGALGWTYTAVLAEFATYADLAAAYASYDDLTINRRRAGA